MSAHSVISHRMFVAALSHDESEEARKRQSDNSTAATVNRSQRSRTGTATQSSGAVAQQLFLLSDAIEFQPVQS